MEERILYVLINKYTDGQIEEKNYTTNYSKALKWTKKKIDKDVEESYIVEQEYKLYCTHCKKWFDEPITEQDIDGLDYEYCPFCHSDRFEERLYKSEKIIDIK